MKLGNIGINISTGVAAASDGFSQMHVLSGNMNGGKKKICAGIKLNPIKNGSSVQE